MNKNKWLKLSLVALGVSAGQAAIADEPAPEGFIEGSSLSILNRNLYFNRDFRHGQSSATGNGYAEEWAHGIIGRFESGFTQGSVGVGVDAFAMLGFKLDSGGGRSGARSSVDVLPHNSAGQPEDDYSKVGGAVKARFMNTVVKVGDVFPTTPVVYYGDYRLLPESFRGVTLANTSIEGLTLQGGRLHAMSQPNSSDMREGFATWYGGAVDAPWTAYFGGDYTLNDNVGISLYTSRLKDTWNQHYAGTTLSYPLSDEVTLKGGFNYYKAVDEGKKLLGSFDNSIWSGNAGVQFGAHTVTVSYQRSNGDDDFDYLRQSGAVFLDNSIQYSDFNSPQEKSWQARYDLNMESFGIPGLSFMTRYARGWDADYSNANAIYMRRDGNGNPLTDQKRWERDIEAKYVVQSGSFKDMSFRVRQATTRATDFESDLDEYRLIVEYPLEVL